VRSAGKRASLRGFRSALIMARRIEIRLRPLLLAALAVLAGLPLIATIELRRAGSAVDELLEQGVRGLDEIEDALQNLLDLRASLLEIGIDVAARTPDALRGIERSAAALEQDAADLAATAGEAAPLVETDAALERLRVVLDETAQFLAHIGSEGSAETGDAAGAARRISLEIDRVAAELHRSSRRIAERARAVDDALPRHLAIAFTVVVALTSISLAVLLFALIERARIPDSRRELRRLLASRLRRGALRDPTGRALPRPANAAEVAVRVDRVLHRTPLHQTFFATLRRDGVEHRVWGKRYTWIGALRALLPPFPASYARGTWRALNAMHRAGLPSPEPLAFETTRKLGIPLGHLLLAANFGKLRGFKRRVLDSPKFRTASREERQSRFAALRAFVDRVHAAGLYSIKLRYLHVRKVPARPDLEDRVEFVLCDLDKVCHLPRAPARVRSFLARLDRRRLLRALEVDLRLEERPDFERWAG
jgi:hypothetical protein